MTIELDNVHLVYGFSNCRMAFYDLLHADPQKWWIDTLRFQPKDIPLQTDQLILNKNEEPIWVQKLDVMKKILAPWLQHNIVDETSITELQYRLSKKLYNSALLSADGTTPRMGVKRPPDYNIDYQDWETWVNTKNSPKKPPHRYPYFQAKCKAGIRFGASGQLGNTLFILNNLKMRDIIFKQNDDVITHHEIRAAYREHLRNSQRPGYRVPVFVRLLYSAHDRKVCSLQVSPPPWSPDYAVVLSSSEAGGVNNATETGGPFNYDGSLSFFTGESVWKHYIPK